MVQIQSCDLETNVLGIQSTRDQYFKVLVLVSRQRSWLKTKSKTKTLLNGKVVLTYLTFLN